MTPKPGRRPVTWPTWVRNGAAAAAVAGGLAVAAAGPPPRAGGPPADAPAATPAAPPPATPPAAGRAVERLRLPPLAQSVAEAQVIVVATALDSEPAPPNQKEDAPENHIRWRVVRVLKGEWKEETITTRTPTAAAEFIGKDWVLMLPPSFVAGTHRFAGCYTIKMEDEIKAAIEKQKEDKGL